MAEAVFFRLLHEDVEEKAAALEAHIVAVNGSDHVAGIFAVVDSTFKQIPSSPFAYWAEPIFVLFKNNPKFETDFRTAKRGPSTGDDMRRIRCYWEVPPKLIARQTNWVPYSKGGSFSPYYYDIHLVVAWDETRFTFRDYYGRLGREIPELESSGTFSVQQLHGLDDHTKP